MATITYTSYRKQKLDDTFSVLYAGGSGGGGGTSVSGAYLQKTGDTATGNYTFSTNLLYIDEDANRIGIGTVSPFAKFHVMEAGSASSLYVGDSATGKTYASIGTSSDANGYLNIQAYKTAGSVYGDIILNTSGGNVGVGVSTPLSTLTVSAASVAGPGGEISLINSATATVGNYAALNFGVGNTVYDHDNANAQIKARLVNSSTKATELIFSIWDGNSLGDRLHIASNGYVGIWDPAPSYHFSVNGYSYFQSYVYADANVGTISYSSGFAGSGWQLGYSGGDANLTVDNLTVRKSMSIYELNINQIRATNGSIWASDAVKLAYVTDHTTYYTVWIDGDGDNPYNIVLPFATNDIVRCQKWNGRDLKYYTAIVYPLIDDISFELLVIDGTGIPAAGDVLVRIGNSTDTNRQGSIYLTASDTNAPYIDVLDGVTSASFSGKTKVRLGKLTGITDSYFGALSGYGLYTQNAYLTGAIYSGEGYIGGFTINSTYLAKDTGTASTSAGMSPSDYPFYAGATYTNRGIAPFRVSADGTTLVTSLIVRTSDYDSINNYNAIYMGITEDPNIFAYINSSSVALIRMRTDSSFGGHSILFSEGGGIFYGEYGATGMYINGGSICTKFYDDSSEFYVESVSNYLFMRARGLPTSTAGLSPGDIYTNSAGYVRIIP